jgi:hypothetical protein
VIKERKSLLRRFRWRVENFFLALHRTKAANEQKMLPSADCSLSTMLEELIKMKYLRSSRTARSVIVCCRAMKFEQSPIKIIAGCLFAALLLVLEEDSPRD